MSYGRDYSGLPAAERPWREDLEAPVVYWVPSIAASGIQFYSGAPTSRPVHCS